MDVLGAIKVPQVEADTMLQAYDLVIARDRLVALRICLVLQLLIYFP